MTICPECGSEITENVGCSNCGWKFPTQSLQHENDWGASILSFCEMQPIGTTVRVVVHSSGHHYICRKDTDGFWVGLAGETQRRFDREELATTTRPNFVADSSAVSFDCLDKRFSTEKVLRKLASDGYPPVRTKYVFAKDPNRLAINFDKSDELLTHYQMLLSLRKKGPIIEDLERRNWRFGELIYSGPETDFESFLSLHELREFSPFGYNSLVIFLRGQK